MWPKWPVEQIETSVDANAIALDRPNISSEDTKVVSLSMSKDKLQAIFTTTWWKTRNT